MDYIKEKLGEFELKISEKVSLLISTMSTAILSLAVAGAGTIGNYTSAQTNTDITTAAPGILSAFGMLVDMVIYLANQFFLQNALGQIYISMACLLFVFILGKSLLRHSSGRRR